MASINKVILIGYLGADPDMRYTPSGTAVANFNMATTEQWTDKDGERKERTEWHRIVVWRKLAETCGKYLHKGSLVYIDGRLQTRTWEDRDGNKRWTTEIIAQGMQMLDKVGKTSDTESFGEEFPSEEPANVPEDDIPF